MGGKTPREDIKRIFAEQFRTWLRDENQRREDAGQPRLTQATIAEQLGIENAHVIKSWKDGQSLPSTEHLYLLHKVFGVSAHYLLGLDTLSEGGSGLHWTISMLPTKASGGVGSVNVKELEQGIALFQHIIKNQSGLQDIRKDKRFAGLEVDEMWLLLRKALLSGTVRFTDVSLDETKAGKLKEKYGDKLEKCLVSNLSLPESIKGLKMGSLLRIEATAFLAAHQAINQLTRDVQSVGLAGGTLMSRCIDLLPVDSPNLRHITWHSMLSTAGREAPIGSTANGLIGRLVYTQPQTHGYRMPFINLARRSDDYFYSANKDPHEAEELRGARDVLTRAKNVQTIFMSIGGRSNYTMPGNPGHVLAMIYGSFATEIKQRCYGDVLLRLIDKDGKTLSNPISQDQSDAVVYSIGLDDLREIVSAKRMVWVVADKEEKAAGIHAALLSGLVNCLVIDSGVANRLLLT